MVTAIKDYHRLVQAGIVLFGKTCQGKTILTVSGGGKTLFIHHSTNRRLRPLEYKPDAIFVAKDRRKIVFQVLGSQAKKNREIEADMIRAFLCSEVSRIVFIAPTVKYYNNIVRISGILQDALLSYGLKEKAIPIIIVLKIPKIRRSKAVIPYLSGIKKKLFEEYTNHRPY
jgi:hypothetical protein